MWEGGLSSNGEVIFFFFNDTATTEICTLSLHDALPISRTSRSACGFKCSRTFFHHSTSCSRGSTPDRKSTRLNSSHDQNSDAVFCLEPRTELRTPEISQTRALHPARLVQLRAAQ